jgi:hypothetical protein
MWIGARTRVNRFKVPGKGNRVGQNGDIGL